MFYVLRTTTCEIQKLVAEVTKIDKAVKSKIYFQLHKILVIIEK